MPKSIKIVKHNEQERLKGIFDKTPPWIFVGSTISMFYPTYLPMGQNLSRSLSDWIQESNSFEVEKKEMIDEIRKDFDHILFEHIFEKSTSIHKAKQSINSFIREANPNEYHEILIFALLEGKISGIITTNYDLCFEKTKAYKDLISIIVDEKDTENYLTGDKIIFKIHGSCDDSNGESIKCTMQDEAKMPEWKSNFLTNILENQVMIFTGYSGLDFEICNEIINLNSIEVYWNNIFDYKKLSIDAKKVVSKFDGEVLVGDISNIIQMFTPIKIMKMHKEDSELERKSEFFINIIKSKYSKTELNLWFVQLLNSCGLAGVAYQISKKMLKLVSKKNNYYIEQLAAAAYKMGKYKISGNKYFLAAHRFRNNKLSMIRLLIDSVESFKAGFMLFKSSFILRLSQILIARIRDNISYSNNSINYLITNMNNRKNELGSRINNFNKYQVIKRILLMIVRFSQIVDIREATAFGGIWITNINDKVSHAHGKAPSNKYYEASIKMEYIGCVFEYIYHYRRYIEKKFEEEGKRTFNKNNNEIILSLIKKTEMYKLNPETWKLKKFLSKLGILPRSEWLLDFYKCEYSFYGRMMLKKGIINT